MKKIYLFVCVVLGIFTITNATAQSSVTSSGISVQGIARDINNEALANIDQLDLKFELYYFIGNSTTPTVFLSSTATIKTDNFGVFSYVVGINPDQSFLISSQSTYLRVSSLDVVFSDEKLQTVPYSIYAQNGVPTGSIMPYIGTTAPNGWLLCDGSVIPSGIYYDKLRTLIGSGYAPDLRGLFLRGTGNVTGYTGKSGPTIKTIQDNSTLEHNHGVGSLSVSNNGSHSHTIDRRANSNNGTYDRDNGRSNESSAITSDQPVLNSFSTSAVGNHNHTLSGATAANGSTETRPINYGVNYIIKI